MFLSDHRSEMPSADGEESSPAERHLQAVEAQRASMLRVFQQAGITRANFALEVLSVARAAAAESQFAPAAKLYEIVGRSIGAVGGESHLHLHTADPNVLMQRERLAAMTDVELLELAEGREARQAEVVSVTAGPDEIDPLFR